MYLLSAFMEDGGHFSERPVGIYSTAELAKEAAEAIFPVKNWSGDGTINDHYPVWEGNLDDIAFHHTPLCEWSIYQLEVDARPKDEVVAIFRIKAHDV